MCAGPKGSSNSRFPAERSRDTDWSHSSTRFAHPISLHLCADIAIAPDEHAEQSGTMIFSQMSRGIFGHPTAEVIVAQADRLRAKRVFLLAGRTLDTKADEISKV